MVHMAERCGAWQVGDDPDGGEVQFRIFLPAGPDPHIASIRVGGGFQGQLGVRDWDFAGGLPMIRDTSDPRGDFWTARTGAPLREGFYEYKYLVEFDNGEARIVTDPCARYGGLSDRNSAVVVGGSTPSENVVRPLKGGRRPLEDLTVYELMVDDFTAGYRRARAPLDAVTDRLDDLAAMGINAILFMPWTAWKHQESDWGYEPFQFFAVEARYANDVLAPQEKLSWLKQLVSACHDRGIHVIMDGVFNHVAQEFPYPQLYQDPAVCPYTDATFVAAFVGLADLDFANPCTGELIVDVCRYWIETFGLDGLRLDNTVNYFAPGEPRGLPEVVGEVRSWLEGRGEQNFSFTIEHIRSDAVAVTEAVGATSFWDNSLYDLFTSGIRDGVGPGLLNALNNRRFQAEGRLPTLYLSNHDHSQPGWFAGSGNLTEAWWRLQPWLIALFTSTAVPMLMNGQEFGEEHFLPEDDHGTGRRVLPRPLRWKQHDDPVGRPLVALHTALGRIRLGHPALRSPLMYPASWDSWMTQPGEGGIGMDVAAQTAVHHRWASVDGGVQNIVVVLNFSDADRTVRAPFPLTGPWTDLLAGFDGGPPWSLDVTGSSVTVPVGSHWGRILRYGT